MVCLLAGSRCPMVVLSKCLKFPRHPARAGGSTTSCLSMLSSLLPRCSSQRRPSAKTSTGGAYRCQPARAPCPCPCTVMPTVRRHGYIVGYEPKTEGQKAPSHPSRRSRLVPHTDDSEVTLNVCLGRDFSGGQLRVMGSRGTGSEMREEAVITPKVGHAVLHAGRKLHEVLLPLSAPSLPLSPILSFAVLSPFAFSP